MEKKRRSPWIGLIIFTLLCVLLLLPMLLSGELLKMEQVACLQQHLDNDSLYGSAYSNSYSHYKYQMLTRRRAPVLAMGDSRVLQFKAAFFKNEEDFYNAGTIAVTPKALVTTLKNIPDAALPKVILFGIDHSALTKQGVYLSPFDTPDFLKAETTKTLNMLPAHVAGDLHIGKYTIWDMMKKPGKIGMMAKLKNAGFMRDGSYYYGDIYHGNQTAEQRIQPYMERIRTGADWFCGAESIYDETLKDYAEFADLCKQKGIYLVAFAPPFSPMGYEAYAARPDTAFLKDIDEKVGSIFTSRGFEFYNYTNPSTMHFTNDFFIDAFHGSDVAYLRMTRDMVRKGSGLGAYVDVAKLDAYDTQRISDLVLVEGM